MQQTNYFESPYVIMSAFSISYLVLGGILLFLNKTNHPTYIKYSKIVSKEPGMDRVIKAMPQVLINLFVYPYLTIFIFGLFFTHPKPETFTYMEFPKLVLSYYLSDFMLYHMHKACHESIWLMKHVHAKHHEFKLPLAILGFYCSAYELIFINILPIVISIHLLNMHFISQYIVIIFGAISVAFAHDRLTLIKTKHDLHHMHPGKNQHFGFTDFFDILYGTN